MLRIKRIYEEVSDDDGYRILVDRLWPRGISKEKAHIDYWAKEIAPSNSVRKAFNHEPEKYEDFKKAYMLELDKNRVSQEACDFLNLIRDKLCDGNVTFLFGAKNREMNQAVVLKEWIEKIREVMVIQSPK